MKKIPPIAIPATIVIRVEKGAESRLFEIPGKHYEAVPKSLPVVMLGMLHGGTVRLK
jgi:hypothetical protein